MTFQIDQSGKIEQTNLDTIIALSNEYKYAIIFKKKDKRILQKYFRDQNKPRMFIYSTFATLIALIVKAVKPSKKIIIDIEYLGHQDILKKQIIDYLDSMGFKKKIVLEFGFVGKTSKAHQLAAQVAFKKIKPNKIVNIKEVVKVLSFIKK